MKPTSGGGAWCAALRALALGLVVVLASVHPVWAAPQDSPPAPGTAADGEPGFYVTADRVVARGVTLSLLPEGLRDPFGVVLYFQEAWVDGLAITEDLGDEAGRPAWMQITSDGTAHVTRQSLRTDLFSLLASLEAPGGDPIGQLLELLSGAARGQLVLRHVAMRVLRVDAGQARIPAMRVRYVQDPSQLRDWDRIVRSREQSRRLWARHGSLDGYPRDGDRSALPPLPADVAGLLQCVQRELELDAERLLGAVTALDPAHAAAELQRGLQGLLAANPQAALACLPQAAPRLARDGRAAAPRQPHRGGSLGSAGMLPGLPLPALPPALPLAPRPVQDLVDCVVNALHGLLGEPERSEVLATGLDGLATWLEGVCRADLASPDGKATEWLRATLRQVLDGGLLDGTVARVVADLLAVPQAVLGAGTGSAGRGDQGPAGPAQGVQGVTQAVGGVVGGVVDAGTTAVQGTLDAAVDVADGAVTGVADALKAAGKAVRSLWK